MDDMAASVTVGSNAAMFCDSLSTGASCEPSVSHVHTPTTSEKDTPCVLTLA